MKSSLRAGASLARKNDEAKTLAARAWLGALLSHYWTFNEISHLSSPSRGGGGGHAH